MEMTYADILFRLSLQVAALSGLVHTHVGIPARIIYKYYRVLVSLCDIELQRRKGPRELILFLNHVAASSVGIWTSRAGGTVGYQSFTVTFQTLASSSLPSS